MPVKAAADRLQRDFTATVELMTSLARACGHTCFDQFELGDLSTWKRKMSELSGVAFGGVT